MSSLAPQILTSDAEATAIGYEEGKSRRGAGAAENRLPDEIEWFEHGWPDERGERCPHNDAWRRGFKAGFLGRGMP
jgi:hypothetical protein